MQVVLFLNVNGPELQTFNIRTK